MSNNPRKPQAFVLESAKLHAHKAAPKIEFTALPVSLLPATAPMAAAEPQRRRSSWGHIFIIAVLALITLWFSLTLTKLINDAFTWSMSLGWISVALASVAGIALLMVGLHEIIGLARLHRIERLQIHAARAINQNDKSAAAEATKGLQKIYANRPDLRWQMAQWQSHISDIIDPPDAMRLAERLLLEPLDEQARIAIAKRARRVTLLTTVMPTATLDILLVGSQNLFMIREVAEIYGGRPSFIATLRLARMVATHLAVAAGLALSDNLLHLVVGKGVLGRLSARFGEGAINGILTSRIGLAACDVCRPIAFSTPRKEALGALIKELAGLTASKDELT
ncbi:MAG: TIGR01620 family protein [Pseudomonadota bacterium]|nr:TIGR01620 family protein [Pseudomonadota bacterium]